MSSLEEIEEQKGRPLSSDELLELVNGKAKIVLYSELHKYSDINQLLSPHGAIFLLFLQKPSYGHWTALFYRNKAEIEFFDPLGEYPDAELKWTSPDMRKKLHMDYPYLSQLLLTAPESTILTYNDHKFQKDNSSTATCGRWCAARVAARNQSLAEFTKLFNLKAKNNDELITKVTIDI
jgi:hypothetical protein